MLVLTRKSGEQIQIGDDIRITILSNEGGKVKVGIDAPKAVTVLRTELIHADHVGDVRCDAVVLAPAH